MLHGKANPIFSILLILGDSKFTDGLGNNKAKHNQNTVVEKMKQGFNLCLQILIPFRFLRLETYTRSQTHINVHTYIHGKG